MPEYWRWISLATITFSLLGIYVNYALIQYRHVSTALIVVCFFALGFSWNAHYAQSRLAHVLSIEHEGKDLILKGRVNALPQSSPIGAKFSFEVDQAFLGRERIELFPPQIYLSWQPAWRNPQDVPEVIPGQRWELKMKLKDLTDLLIPILLILSAGLSIKTLVQVDQSGQESSFLKKILLLQNLL